MKGLPLALAWTLALLATACKDAPVTPAPGEEGSGSSTSTGEPPPTQQADRRTELAVEMGTLMAAFGESVRGVSDALTWEKARVEITAIITRIEVITAELKSLPTPAPSAVAAYRDGMATHEAALESSLGNKTSFLRNLPPETSAALQQLAGEFSRKMGSAQQTLYGTAASTP